MARHKDDARAESGREVESALDSHVRHGTGRIVVTTVPSLKVFRRVSGLSGIGDYASHAVVVVE